MLETAKLELFCTSISAPDKNVNLYHNLIIFLNKASTENPFGHSGFKQSMKSIQPWKQRVRNLGICHQSSLLALCLQQTASSSTVKYCQDTTPPQIPWWCIMIIQLTLEQSTWISVQEIHISSAQATGSWICGRGTADTEDFWLHGGSALLISVLFKGQVQLQIILKVSLK